MKKIPAFILSFVLAGCAGTFLIGCQAEKKSTAPSQSQPAASTAAPVAAPTPVAAAPVSKSAIRIKAGSTAPFTDSSGNVWQADQGFDGGDTVERPDVVIANTKDPGLYQAEHYSMNSFSCKLPNGKYLARLHFAETFDGITGPGQRVFTLNVQGHELKDIDVWAKAGGANRAYVESVPVEVTNGEFKIVFTTNVENPQINGIEIIPQP